MTIDQKTSITTEHVIVAFSMKARSRRIIPDELLQSLPPGLRDTPLPSALDLRCFEKLLPVDVHVAADPDDLLPGLVTLVETSRADENDRHLAEDSTASATAVSRSAADET
jgi:hypothetical protein